MSGFTSLISMVSSCLSSCHSSKKSLFCFYQQYKSSESSEPKLKSRQASNHCKSVFEAAKLAYYNGTKGSITLHKIGSGDSVFNKSKSPVHSLFLYLTTCGYYLLHLIKKNYLLKSHLRTLILML